MSESSGLRIVTCADANFLPMLVVLLRSNEEQERLPVTVYDWGLPEGSCAEWESTGRLTRRTMPCPQGDMTLSKVGILQQERESCEEHLLFLDADFIITGHLREDLLAVQGDVAITPTFHKKSYRWVNSGFFLARNTPGGHRFVREWYQACLMSRRGYWYVDQETLGALTKPYFPSGDSPLAKIVYMYLGTYNNTPGKNTTPPEEAKLLHMRGGRWHDLLLHGKARKGDDRLTKLKAYHDLWRRLRGEGP